MNMKLHVEFRRLCFGFVSGSGYLFHGAGVLSSPITEPKDFVWWLFRLYLDLMYGFIKLDTLTSRIFIDFGGRCHTLVLLKV